MGRVLPERAQVSVPTIQMPELATDPVLPGVGIRSAVLSIQVSQLSMSIEVEGSSLDLETLKNTVENLARAVVDVVGFSIGAGYDVEITSVVHEDGFLVVFGVGVDALRTPITEPMVSAESILRLSLSTRSVRFVLGALREGVRMPEYTGLFSYLAIEMILQDFRNGLDSQVRDKDKGKELAWSSMRHHLRVGKDWLRQHKAYADAMRHGKIVFISGSERVAMMVHTRQLISRYLVFIERGRTPLPEDEFPHLGEID